MKSKFCRKIRDGIFVEFGRMMVRPGLFVREVGMKIIQNGAGAGGKMAVLQARAQFLLRHFAQNGDGIMIKILPAARREFVKEILRLLIPAPPEIAGQFVQARDQSIQFRSRKGFFRHSFRFLDSTAVKELTAMTPLGNKIFQFHAKKRRDNFDLSLPER
jgi:hypothetical protein